MLFSGLGFCLGFPLIPHFQLQTNTAIIEFLANKRTLIRIIYCALQKKGDERINAHFLIIIFMISIAQNTNFNQNL